MTGIFEIKAPTKVKGQFCLLAFRYYCEDNNIELGDLGNKLADNNLFAISDLIYFALKAYADLHDKEFTLTKAKFTNYFGEVSEAELANIIAKLQEVKLFGKKLGEQAQEASSNKKK